MGDKPTDFNDLAAQQGKGAVASAIAGAVEVDWSRRIQRGGKHGEIRPELLNVYLILLNEEPWRGVIAMDEFAHRIVKRRKPPIAHSTVGDWTNADDSRTHMWIAEKFGVDVSTAVVAEAVQLVAEANAFHPVREYLRTVAKPAFEARREQEPSQQWVDWWLLNYLGAAHHNDERVLRYIKRASRLWLLALVARVMHPGCKADYAIILEGQQGLGKSSALGIIGGEWFSDTAFVMGDKDSYEGLRGVWVKEIAELDAFNKAESTRSKAFISGQIDWFRPPYGRRHEAFARQCLFAGTTNQNEYFRDNTGNRRFWPVYCTWFEREELMADRDVILGHAFSLYEQHLAEPDNAECQWWPRQEDASDMQAQQELREIFDPWESLIAAWLYAPEQLTRATVTTAEILTECLKIDTGRIDERAMATRVGRCMRKLKWDKVEAGTREQRRVSRFHYERPAERATQAE